MICFNFPFQVFFFFFIICFERFTVSFAFLDIPLPHICGFAGSLRARLSHKFFFFLFLLRSRIGSTYSHFRGRFAQSSSQSRHQDESHCSNALVPARQERQGSTQSGSQRRHNGWTKRCLMKKDDTDREGERKKAKSLKII